MATITGAKIKTLPDIIRQIISTRQALKKRLTELAAPVAAAIEAADNAAGKTEKAAARKAINASHKAFLEALGHEATAAYQAAKQLSADAAAVAESARDETTAASWDWHKGSEGRKARNALTYMFKCIREDTGLDLSFDERKNAYVASVPAVKTDGKKKNSAPKVSAETDGRTVAANQSAALASAADQSASAADDAANDEKAAALLAAMIEKNREAVLLALASAYPDRDSLIEAVMMIPVGAFPAVGKLSVTAG